MRAALERMLADCGAALAEVSSAECAIADVPRGARLPALAIPIVVLVGEGARAAELIGAGARGVLRRDCDGARLAAALVAVCAGLVVVDGPLAERALPEPSPLPADDEELTARERQLLTLLASGLSNRRIAERLAISEHTVKFHVSSILAKLGVATRTEAVVAAARRGLLWL
ncbi:MAG: response regulator transcription factor [Sandaracinaceae bacterium]|nr:response regulator transcription factor [Sandaracinaceae bacterium]